MLPLVWPDWRSSAHADAVTRPDAVEAGFERSVLQHQIEAVEAHIAAKRALEHDDRQTVRDLVAEPKIDRERVPAIDLKHRAERRALIAIEADGLSVDTGHALEPGNVSFAFCAGRFVAEFFRIAVERKISGEINVCDGLCRGEPGCKALGTRGN